MSYHVTRFAKPKICGNCKWHCQETDNDWICDNEYSENYMDYTEYEDHCDDYEERGRT